MILRPAPRAAPLTIDFAIVGGGIAGLACAIALRRVGHRVTVLERKNEERSRGAGGVRLAPNSTKILYHWGLKEQLQQLSLVSAFVTFCKYDSGDFLGSESWPDDFLKETNGDFLLMRHGDLHQLLFDTAIAAGVHIRHNAEVVDIQEEDGEVTLASGEVLTADMIVGADGHSGVSRAKLIGQQDRGTPVGVALYDTTVPKRLVPPEVQDMLTDAGNAVHGSFGNKRAVVCYRLQGEAFAFQFYKEDEGIEGQYGDDPVDIPSDLLDHCDPRLQVVIRNAKTAVRVRIRDYEELEDWFDERLVLIGDAAHPFPPASIQACAMAIEDGAVLGKLFSHLHAIDQIPSFLTGFQELRQVRCSGCRIAELENIMYMMLEDGEDQRKRDALMRARTKAGERLFGGEGLDVMKQWEEVVPLFAYNCEDAADDWWVQWGLLRERAREGAKENGMGGEGNFMGLPINIQVRTVDAI